MGERRNIFKNQPGPQFERNPLLRKALIFARGATSRRIGRALEPYCSTTIRTIGLFLQLKQSGMEIDLCAKFGKISLEEEAHLVDVMNFQSFERRVVKAASAALLFHIMAF